MKPNMIVIIVTIASSALNDGDNSSAGTAIDRLINEIDQTTNIKRIRYCRIGFPLVLTFDHILDVYEGKLLFLPSLSCLLFAELAQSEAYGCGEQRLQPLLCLLLLFHALL
jgi:hypothetical protein